VNAKRAALAIVLVGSAFFAARAFASRRELGAGAGELVGAGAGELGGFALEGGYWPGELVPTWGSFGDLLASVPEPTSEAEPVNANLRAFLDMIAAAEGADYNVRFGGARFDDLSDHPRIRTPFKQTDGKTNYSTAAGRYQFLARTWDELAEQLGLPDFSPASQDAAAIELIRQRGALRDVVVGNFEEAVRKVRSIWASLPGSPYPQRTRSWDFVKGAYREAGGQGV